MQGKHLAFEPRLSFQKMRKHYLIDYFSLLAAFFADFLYSFSYWLNEYTGVIPQLLKKGLITLLAFEKLSELSIGV